MRSGIWQRALTFIRETWQGEVLNPTQDHTAGGGKMVEPSGHPSDADLIERAVRNAGYLIMDGEVPHWAAVRDTFAVNDAAAVALCRRFGFDPDAMVGCFVEVEEEKPAEEDGEPTAKAPPPAAKVAADKQPWERELERLGTAKARFCSMSLAELELLDDLCELNTLLRVVESGQGSAGVPPSVMSRLDRAHFAFAPQLEGWMAFGWGPSEVNFAHKDVITLFNVCRPSEELLSALHAAGNELVKGGGG